MRKARTIAVIALSALVTATYGLAQSNGNDKARANGQQGQKGQQGQTKEEMRFRGMDTDNDGVITRAEWRGDDQSFREHDVNHDGVLSGEEVRPAIQADSADRSRREEMIARFERADRNHDGRIARDEWTGSTAAFKRMDENGDGIVTREEFSAIVADRQAGTSGTAVSRNTTRAYQAGHDKGLIEGRQAGREDKSLNGGQGHWDLEGQRELEQADSGYTPNLGVRADYQAGYREGFRLGYREGFGPRR